MFVHLCYHLKLIEDGIIKVERLIMKINMGIYPETLPIQDITEDEKLIDVRYKCKVTILNSIKYLPKFALDSL